MSLLSGEIELYVHGKPMRPLRVAMSHLPLDSKLDGLLGLSWFYLFIGRKAKERLDSSRSTPFNMDFDKIK